jgi:hypothetical protein
MLPCAPEIIKYRTITLPVVLYGCETLLVELKGRTDRMFENKVLRRIFGPMKKEVTLS